MRISELSYKLPLLEDRHINFWCDTNTGDIYDIESGNIDYPSHSAWAKKHVLSNDYNDVYQDMYNLGYIRGTYYSNVADNLNVHLTGNDPKVIHKAAKQFKKLYRLKIDNILIDIEKGSVNSVRISGERNVNIYLRTGKIIAGNLTESYIRGEPETITWFDATQRNADCWYDVLSDKLYPVPDHLSWAQYNLNYMEQSYHWIFQNTDLIRVSITPEEAVFESRTPLLMYKMFSKIPRDILKNIFTETYNGRRVYIEFIEPKDYVIFEDYRSLVQWMNGFKKRPAITENYIRGEPDTISWYEALIKKQDCWYDTGTKLLYKVGDGSIHMNWAEGHIKHDINEYIGYNWVFENTNLVRVVVYNYTVSINCGSFDQILKTLQSIPRKDFRYLGENFTIFLEWGDYDDLSSMVINDLKSLLTWMNKFKKPINESVPELLNQDELVEITLEQIIDNKAYTPFWYDIATEKMYRVDQYHAEFYKKHVIDTDQFLNLQNYEAMFKLRPMIRCYVVRGELCFNYPDAIEIRKLLKKIKKSVKQFFDIDPIDARVVVEYNEGGRLFKFKRLVEYKQVVHFIRTGEVPERLRENTEIGPNGFYNEDSIRFLDNGGKLDILSDNRIKFIYDVKSKRVLYCNNFHMPTFNRHMVPFKDGVLDEIDYLKAYSMRPFVRGVYDGRYLTLEGKASSELIQVLKMFTRDFWKSFFSMTNSAVYVELFEGGYTKLTNRAELNAYIRGNKLNEAVSLMSLFENHNYSVNYWYNGNNKDLHEFPWVEEHTIWAKNNETFEEDILNYRTGDMIYWLMFRKGYVRASYNYYGQKLTVHGNDMSFIRAACKKIFKKMGNNVSEIRIDRQIKQVDEDNTYELEFCELADRMTIAKFLATGAHPPLTHVSF